MNKELYHERLKALEKFTPLLSHYTAQEGALSSRSNNSTVGSSVTAAAKPSSAAELAIRRQNQEQPRTPQGPRLTSPSSYRKSRQHDGRPSLAQRMNAYLHRNDMDPVGGALCLLPSLEFRNSDDDACGMTGVESDLDTQGSMSSMNTMASSTNADSILPSLGQHHHSDVSSLLAGSKDASATQKIPAMAASIFDMLSVTTQEMPSSNSASSNNNSNDAAAAADNNMNENDHQETKSQDAKENNTEESSNASQNLSRSISYTRSSISQAPSTLQKNLLSSFQSLVDSRVRAWTLLLLRHSLAKGDSESRQRLLSLLAAQQDIVPASVVMDWALVERSAGEKDMQCHQVLDMWKRKEEQRSCNGSGIKKEEGKEEIQGTPQGQEQQHQSSSDDAIGQIWRRIPTHECDLVIPVRMTVTVDMIIQEKIMTIQLTAPGTLAAMYHSKTSKICYLEAKLDTCLLIDSMVEQARLVVFEAVARATSFGGKKEGDATGGGQESTVVNNGKMPIQNNTIAGDLPDRSLMKFGSALTLGNSSSANNGVALRSPIEEKVNARSGMTHLHSSSHFISPSVHSKSQPSLSELKATASARRFSNLLNSRPKLVGKSVPNANESTNSRNNLSDGENTGQRAQRTSQPILKMPERRQRSVTWTQPESISEHPPQSNANESFHVASSNSTIRSSPAPKRRKLMSGSLKRSSKSFGKPDANTFSCVRNATFGEFGHLKHAHVLDMVGKQKKLGMVDSGAGMQLSYHASTAQLGQHRSALRNSTWSSNRMSCLDTTQSLRREDEETQIVSSHSSLSSGSGCITGDAKRTSSDVFTVNTSSYQSQVERAVSSNTINSLLNRSSENESKHGRTVGILKRTPTQLESLLLSAAKGEIKK